MRRSSLVSLGSFALILVASAAVVPAWSDTTPAQKRLYTIPEDGLATDTPQPSRFVRELTAARSNEDLIICVAGCPVGRDRVVYAQPAEPKPVELKPASDKVSTAVEPAPASEAAAAYPTAPPTTEAAAAAPAAAFVPTADVPAPSAQPAAAEEPSAASENTEQGSESADAMAAKPTPRRLRD